MCLASGVQIKMLRGDNARGMKPTPTDISKASPPAGERGTRWEKRRCDEMNTGGSERPQKEGFTSAGKFHLDSFTCISRQGSRTFTSGQERMCGRQQSVNNAALPWAELQAAS